MKFPGKKLISKLAGKLLRKDKVKKDLPDSVFSSELTSILRDAHISKFEIVDASMGGLKSHVGLIYATAKPLDLEMKQYIKAYIANLLIDRTSLPLYGDQTKITVGPWSEERLESLYMSDAQIHRFTAMGINPILGNEERFWLLTDSVVDPMLHKPTIRTIITFRALLSAHLIDVKRETGSKYVEGISQLLVEEGLIDAVDGKPTSQVQVIDGRIDIRFKSAGVEGVVRVRIQIELLYKHLTELYGPFNAFLDKG